MTGIPYGPPGIESTHTWNQGPLVINDRNATAHIKITGLPDRGLSDPGDQWIRNVGRRGGWEVLGVTRGMSTWTYEGVIRGATLEALRTASNFAQGALANPNVIGRMDITGVMGGPSWYYRARCVAVKIPDEQAKGPNAVWPWEREFRAQFSLGDPRIYVAAAATQANTTGSAALVNSGTTDTDPFFNFPTFAGGTLEVVNTTTGRNLKFTDLPAGVAYIDFHNRVLSVGSVDWTGAIDPDCDWWDPAVAGLQPGSNTVNVPGGITWNASWNHAVEG